MARLREDTPGLAGPGTPIAHFNNAGSALPPKPVLDAQLEYLALEAVAGGYETAELRSADLRRPYAALAALLNCAPDEIAVTQSATSAWQLAFSSFRFRPGDVVLTARAEYASNYIAYLQAAESHGIVIETVPSDASGQLDVDALDRILSSRVPPGANALVSATHVPTSGGLVNPAERIGAVAKKHGAAYLLDACQSVGQMPVDVRKIRCDFLVGTGRKYLRGPRGIGFLFASSAFLETTRAAPAQMDLHGARWTSADRFEAHPGARRFEQYEVAFAAKVGLGVAAEYCLAVGVDAAWARTRALAETLRRRLAETPGVTVRDVGEVRCGIVSFDVAGVGAGDVRAALAERGVNVWTSIVRNNTRLEWESRNRPGGAGGDEDGMPEEVVRASAHYVNADEDVTRLVDAVKELAGERGGFGGEVVPGGAASFAAAEAFLAERRRAEAGAG